MTPQALAGVRAIDLSQGIAGPYCTKQLAALGAEVIKVEPPAGDPSRRMGPFVGDDPHPEKSVLVLYLNTGKKSVTLDLGAESGRRTVEALARDADVLVESFAPGTMDQLGLSHERLQALNPRLVITAVSVFGQYGSYRGYQADEINLYAWGGLMGITGERDREPLKNGGWQAQYQAGLSALAGTLTALYGRLGDGRGELVDVSIMETVALMVEPWMIWNYVTQGTLRGRLGNHSIIPPRGTWPCADGWVTVIPSLWRNWEAFAALTGNEALRDERFATNAQRARHADEIMALLLPWLLDHTREEIYHSAQRLGLLFGYVATVDEILASPQLRARGYFVELDHPVAGRLTYPGAPVKLTATPYRFTRAPLLGEHSADLTPRPPSPKGTGGIDAPLPLRGRGAGGEGRPVPRPPAPGPRLPLTGVRVLDLSRVWAGPLATKFLADMGAEVIKVQPVRHFALDRLDNATGYWHQCNANKQAICIEFARPEGIALFKGLAAVSDVVLENFTPRVMPGFGLGYDVLSRINPQLVMISCPAMGTTGPEAGYAALGESIEALAGIVAQTGYRDEDRPMKSGINYADPIVGMQAAAAVLAALVHRRRTGAGQFIDLSMRETTVSLIGEQILDYAANGRLPQRIGNRHPFFAPQGAYRCRGEDQWLTICVRSDAEWRALCNVIGRPELAADPRVADVAGRRAHHDELDAILSEWAEAQDKHRATEALQAAGVAAAPVLHIPELIADPHLNARRFWVPVEQPGFGTHPYPTLPFQLTRAPVEVKTPPPQFAEHNRRVLGGLLGLSEAEVARLEAARVISPQPLPYSPTPDLVS